MPRNHEEIIAEIQDHMRKLGGSAADWSVGTAKDSRGPFFASHRVAERERTIEAVLAITGQKELLGTSPALARAIRNRLPYLDPLNHLQVELLKRYRSGRASERVARGIHMTINGIAAGLRNSG